MRQVMPPATPDGTSSDTFARPSSSMECKVKASITGIKNTDEEVIQVLAPEIEKFGMIKMTIKIATDDKGSQYRWVVIQFDDLHDFTDFKHYILNQKGTVTIFGHLLDFKFYSGKTTKTQEYEDMKKNRKRRHIENNKNDDVGGDNTTKREDIVVDEDRSDNGLKNKNDQNMYENGRNVEKRYDDFSNEEDNNKVDSGNETHHQNSEGYFAGACDTKTRCFQRYDDKTPTRTLYFGNLDRNIDALRVKRHFAKYGKILDVVVKRQGRFAAYGFVKFLHLRDALEAKNQLTGSYVGRQRMAVGFGSICQTCLVWIGDYTRQIDVDEICREVKKYSDYLDYSLGKEHSYIYFVFKDIQDSLKVIQNIRGLRLNNYRYPVQVDFADPLFESHELYERYHKGGSHKRNISRRHSERSPPVRSPTSKTKTSNHIRNTSVEPFSLPSSSKSPNSRVEKLPPSSKSYNDRNEKSYKRSKVDDSRNHQSSHSRTPKNDPITASTQMCNDEDNKIICNNTAKLNITNIPVSNYSSENTQVQFSNVPPLSTSSQFPLVWKGYFNIKNQYYGTKLHLLSGNNRYTINLPKNVTSSVLPAISFHKRYPLNKDDLDEFKTNLASAVLCNDYCAFLGLPNNTSNSNNELSYNNEKPLKEMISYLQEKNTAVHITDFDPSNQLSLYVFPPCDFSKEFLSTTLPPDNKMVLSLAATYHVLVFIIAK